MVVKRRIRQLDDEVLPLLLILESGHTDDGMIMQEGHHAVRVIDDVAFSIVGSEGHSFVRPFGDLVPLHYQVINYVFACSG